jgi:hypothetical protein
MIYESLNSNLPNQTSAILVRTNDLRNTMKLHSTAVDAVHHSRPKSFRLSRTLFDNSVLVIVLTIGLVFGMIQRKYFDKCTGFCVPTMSPFSFVPQLVKQTALSCLKRTSEGVRVKDISVSCKSTLAIFLQLWKAISSGIIYISISSTRKPIIRQLFIGLSLSMLMT